MRTAEAKTVKKPTKRLLEYYSYSECSSYLEGKYGYEERDVAGRFKVHTQVWREVLASHGIAGDSLAGLPPEKIVEIMAEIDHRVPPYQDFWAFVVGHTDAGNDSLITMCEWWGQEAEDWQRTILGYWMDEFGQGKPGARTIDLRW